MGSKQLYLVTDHRIPFDTLLHKVERSLKAGISRVQYRSKCMNSQMLFSQAQALKKLCHQYNVPLIINDRVDIALGIDADGVHLGQDDLPIHVARQLLGKDKLIGASVHNVDEAVEAVKQGADHLGIGALFHTSTKADAKSLSLFILEEIKAHVTVPIYGIGGITTENLTKEYLRYLDGIAVVSAILGEEYPEEAVYTFNQILNKPCS